MSRRACIVGAGPNGLAAAIVLAQAGIAAEVFEAQPQPGGGVRTLELTLPGFLHDFGSAVHPLAIGSPFFSSLPLADYGLQWIHSPVVLAHPLDDGTAVLLHRDLKLMDSSLDADGKPWRQLVNPLAEQWTKLAPEIFRPIRSLPRHLLQLARIGLNAIRPAQTIASHMFRRERTKALFAGLAAHSFLALDEPLSAAFGILLAAAAHAVGWPIPRGGSQSITNALCAYLATLGGKVTTGGYIDKLAALPQCEVTLCDVTPRQLLHLAGERFSPAYSRSLSKYRYGPGVFKVDYALAQPIPWKAKECAQAATVHLGGSMEEIASSEWAMRHGQHAERPFVLLAQPTLFDYTRAPASKHITWAYCHVPNASTFDMLGRLEAQIERFAPGFRDCVLARRVFTSASLEQMDANLVGGDISGGAMDLRQFIFRPTWRHYATSAQDIYICSSSTPPGGGVHGMCGYHAAHLVLARLPS